MFLLSKIFTYSFLSPGLFLLLGLLVLAALISGRRRSAFFLIVLTCCTIYFLSVKPVRDKIIQPLETAYDYAAAPKVDALIVLGGGVRHDTLDKPGQAAPTDSALQRLYYTAQLYHRYKLPIVVCGGEPHGRPTAESIVMAEVLHDLQVPAGKIYQENRSRNTKENLQNSKNYLQKQGYKKIGLVTSAMHMPRAMHTATSLGLTVIPLPCDYKHSRIYYWYDFFPNTNCLQDSFSGIKEYIGLIYYRVFLL